MARQSRPVRARPPAVPAGYSFAFHGFRDDWYLLAADMRIPGQNLDALAFEGRVITWLIDQRLTYHFGAGNTGVYPIVPSDAWDGHLFLLLKRPADVLRLATVFPCTGLSDETLLAAVRAESQVHRFVVEDIAKIAHDAVRRLILTFGDDHPTWENIGGETRVALLQQVKTFMARPQMSAAEIHAAWMEQRIKDKWHYGGQLDQTALTDPMIVPWKNLNAVAKTRYSVFASVVNSLMPLLQ